MLKRLFQIEEKILGHSHTNASTTHEKVGQVHFTKYNYEKARSYYEKAMHIYVNAYGEEHDKVTALHEVIGSLLFEMNNTE